MPFFNGKSLYSIIVDFIIEVEGKSDINSFIILIDRIKAPINCPTSVPMINPILVNPAKPKAIFDPEVKTLLQITVEDISLYLESRLA